MQDLNKEVVNSIIDDLIDLIYRTAECKTEIYYRDLFSEDENDWKLFEAKI